MRREEREQNREFAKRVIMEAEYGVLSMSEVDGSAYAVPVSHVLVGQTIYIHGATQGKKLDLLKRQSQVCFTCVGRTEVLPSQFTTNYESAIACGKAIVVESQKEKEEALFAIAQKYSSSFLKEAKQYIGRAIDQVTVIKIVIEKLTAKGRLDD